MKPRLVEIMEEQVSRLVEQGEFSERREEKGEPAPAKSISLKRISEDLGTDENSFTGIEYTKTNGKVAVTGVSFRNKRYGEKLVLELKFRDMGTHWQLAEFSNLAELLERIHQLDTQKLEEINRPIQDQIV